MQSFIGIERIRDILWKVPIWLKQVPATVAHEYAHQVYYILDQKEKYIIDNLYNKTIKSSLPLVSDYSALNSEEFFAENYSYFVRNLFHKGKIIADSEILNHILYLSDLDKNLKNTEVVF